MIGIFITETPGLVGVTPLRRGNDPSSTIFPIARGGIGGKCVALIAPKGQRIPAQGETWVDRTPDSGVLKERHIFPNNGRVAEKSLFSLPLGLAYNG